MKSFSYRIIPLFLLISNCVLCQNNSQTEIPGYFKMFTIDNLNNIYTINQENIISKYNENGQLFYSVNFKIYGNIFSLDASNPMELLLFYKEQNIALITDNTLSEIAKINLSELGFYEVLICCRSSDNGIWILDGSDFKLKKINNEYNAVIESESINFFTTQDVIPNFLIEHDNYLFLNLPSTSIFIFDLYGNFYKKIAISNLNSFTVIKDKLYYFKDNIFYSYSLKSFEEKVLNLPLKRNEEKTILEVKISNKFLFIQDEESIKVFNN